MLLTWVSFVSLYPLTIEIISIIILTKQAAPDFYVLCEMSLEEQEKEEDVQRIYNWEQRLAR
jgi:hypothetical protein